MRALILFFFLFAIPIHAYAETIMIDSEQAFMAHDRLVELRKEIPEDLRGMFEPIDPSFYPYATPLTKEFGKRLLPMLEDREKAGRVYFMISSSLQVNAYFIDLGNNDRLVGATMGLLWVMGDEDRVVGIKGHELEHGWSQIDEVVKLGRGFRELFLKRAIENEVDVKSVFKRLMKVGGNPYAMKDAIRILRKRYGNGLTATHTSFGSREDTLDSAVTIARRELGLEGITLSTESRLQGGIIPFLNSTTVSSADYEKSLVKNLITRIGPRVEQMAKDDIARLNILDRDDRKSLRTQSDVFDEVWSELLGYLDDAMQDENFYMLRQSLVKSITETYVRLINQELEHGPKIHHRSENQLRRLLTISEPINRSRDILRQQEALIEAQKTLKERLDSYEKARMDKGDAADHSSVEFYEKSVAEHTTNVINLQKEQIFIDSIDSAARDLRLKIVRQASSQFSHLEDWWILQELQLPQDRKLMIYAIDKLTKMNNIGRLRGGGSLTHYIWLFLERTDTELLDQAFRNFCQSAVLRQSYYGMPGLDAHQYPLTALLHVRKEENKSRLRSIAQTDLVAPLQLMIKSILNGTFIPRQHPDPRERDAINARRKSTDADLHRLARFLGHFKEIERANSELESMGLKLDIKSIVDDQVKTRINDLFQAAYLDLHPILREKMPLAQYKRIITLHAGIETIFDEKPLLLPEASELLNMMTFILRDFAKLANQDGVKKNYTNEVFLAWNISTIMSDRSYNNFFNLLSIYGEKKASEDLNSFFQLAHRFSTSIKLTFDRKIDHNSTSVDADGSTHAAYARWLVNNHPDTSTKDAVFEHTRLGNMRSRPANLTPDQEAIYLQNEKSIESMNYATLDRAKLDLAILQLQEEFRSAQTLTTEEKVAKIIEHIDLREALKNLDYVLQNIDVEPSLAFKLFVRSAREIDDKLYESAIQHIHKHTQTEKNHEKLSNYYESFYMLCEKSDRLTSAVDEDFAHLWSKAQTHAAEISQALQKSIAQLAVVKLLRLRRHKIDIFKFRFTTEVLLSKSNMAMDITSIRPEVDHAIALVSELFPKPSDVRDACIDIAGKSLLTNPAETDALYSLSINLDNYQNHDALVYLDAPDHIASQFNENTEKFAWLKYLTGNINLDDLIKELGTRFNMPEHYLRVMAKHALINFQDADVLVRSFVLLPLLDDLEGLLSNAKWQQEVKRLALGPYANSILASAVYDSYFKVLPPGERRVVLAGILAGFIDREKGGKGFISNLVNGLKAMGVKNAQLFRAAGFAPKELHAELDNVFDAALPVRRDRALKQLRQAFGQDLSGLSFYGEGLGFGSVNHVWHLRFRNASGQEVDTAVRMLRENVVGQVRNENEVWIAALADLSQHESAEVRHFASQIEQVRQAIVPNLLPGGVEVDFVKDRSIHQRASAAYTGTGARSGRNIQLVPLLPRIQNMVSPDMQSSVTVMQLIRQTRLAGHPEGAALSEDALRTELRAAFRLGEFDADGHVGNWLPASDSNDLYRTDWSLFTVLDNTEKQAMRDLIKAMLAPRMTRWGQQIIVNNVESFFTLPDETTKATAIRVVESMAVLQGSDPVERIYHLRSLIESAVRSTDPDISLSLSPKMLMVIHSLAKTRMHMEKLGEQRYRQVFAEELGVNLVDRARIVGTHIQQTAISACNGLWHLYNRSGKQAPP